MARRDNALNDVAASPAVTRGSRPTRRAEQARYREPGAVWTRLPVLTHIEWDVVSSGYGLTV